MRIFTLFFSFRQMHNSSGEISAIFTKTTRMAPLNSRSNMEHSARRTAARITKAASGDTVEKTESETP